jgi:hypothetical protein
MIKTCPFSTEKECNSDCPLFVSPEDLNEFVSARLGSIGIVDKKQGSCSLRILALSQSRMVFENTKTRG